ncbi:MAG: hypothetical protein ACPGXY_02370 [Alphaproteobacteria bacterium]
MTIKVTGDLTNSYGPTGKAATPAQGATDSSFKDHLGIGDVVKGAAKGAVDSLATAEKAAFGAMNGQVSEVELIELTHEASMRLKAFKELTGQLKTAVDKVTNMQL